MPAPKVQSSQTQTLTESMEAVHGACSPCRDVRVVVVDRISKGSNHEERSTVLAHQCPACETKITTVGHGKAKVQPDAVLSRSYWDRLEKDAWVLDPHYPYRPMVLFGRSTGPAYSTIYSRLPEFETLLQSPDPVAFARAGYDYVYFDRETWQELPNDRRQAFQQPCVRLIAQQTSELGDFRRLLAIRDCVLDASSTPGTGFFE